MDIKKISLGHGSGGRLTHELIRGLILEKLGNPVLSELSDSAFIDYREKIAFTTDSFVVSPLFFPGGDIGKLAVCGTVNDLAVCGAVPEYLSLSFIIEEGLDYKVLEKIVSSVSREAKNAGVEFVCGDLKVVENSAADKIFINTSGIGRLVKNIRLSTKNIRPGDEIIITGNIAQHGLAVLAKRKAAGLGFNIKSDCASLNNMLIPALKKSSAIRFMRDPTRGGLATTLNEICESSGLGMVIDEKSVPVSSRARAACELLGMDPMYIANEGNAVVVVKKGNARRVLGLLKKSPLAANAKVIGEIGTRRMPKVILKTVIGTSRILDMLTAEALPRIC